MTTAQTPKKALELLEKQDFDVIVSDYQMPDMDGLEFLEVVREERESDIPFIIFTGKGREEVAMEDARRAVKNLCMWQGKDRFLSEYALWSRMSFFSEVFPEPKFVHVVRDGRAEAHEYRKMIEKGVDPEGE